MAGSYEIGNRIDSFIVNICKALTKCNWQQLTFALVNMASMKKILIVLLLFPLLTYSQSKRKKRLAEAKAHAELVQNLQLHVQYLSRMQSATNGYDRQYIIQQYRQIGLEPKGTNGFIQEFEINEGRQVDANTILKVDDQLLDPATAYIPLAFSASKSVKGSASMALNEYKQPWFKDLRDLLEENKDNPQFDVEASIKKEVTTAAAKGATALFVYNSSAIIADHIQFNRYDQSLTVKIPVIYITKEGLKKHFSDHSATLPIELNTSISTKSRKADNLIGFINNHAAANVLLSVSASRTENGIVDNAGGVAALIELARILKKGAFATNNYFIINFYGTDQEPAGSRYWFAHPTIAITPGRHIEIGHTAAEKDMTALVYEVIGSGDKKGELDSRD